MAKKHRKSGTKMSDKPLSWPYIAKDARDRAAEASVAGIHYLEPLLGELPLTDVERMRRVALALSKFQEVARLLESCGAQTRP